MQLFIKGLSKTYASYQVFKDLSLSFSQGVNYLIAPNGTGKSTLLRIIAGIEQQDAGDILFNGKADKFTNYGSYVPDKMTMYPFITGREFIDLVFQAKNIVKDELKHLNMMLQELDIEQYLDVPFKAMSLGTQKKFFIVAGLLGDFSCLLMDDPSNAIDKKSREVIIKYLYQLANDRLILIATHDQDLKKQLPGEVFNLV